MAAERPHMGATVTAESRQAVALELRREGSVATRSTARDGRMRVASPARPEGAIVTTKRSGQVREWCPTIITARAELDQLRLPSRSETLTVNRLNTVVT
jgi:hypothetical protein